MGKFVQYLQQLNRNLCDVLINYGKVYLQIYLLNQSNGSYIYFIFDLIFDDDVKVTPYDFTFPLTLM